MTRIGEIVDRNWNAIPNRFPNVVLDENDLNRFRRYIKENFKTWMENENNPENNGK